MRPVRIDMVSEHASPLAVLGGEDAGGQNVYVAAVATELGRLGCPVTVYTRRDATDLPPRVELAANVVVEHVSAGPPEPIPKDQMFDFMPEFAAQLERRWLVAPPDVVHGHFWMSGWAAAAAATRSPQPLPLVQTFHALGVVKARHQGSADTSPHQRQSVEAALLTHVDRVVATCTDEQSELEALGADPERIRIVPCGIDPSLFRPDGPPLASLTNGSRRTSSRIVVVSRLVARKGIEDVIQALVRLPDTELIVAGGPTGGALERDAEFRRLRTLAQRAGVGARVTFLGGLARQDVPALMRSADVVVSVPWYEPFGIVPLEAMACGVPVVGSAVGGLLDTVQPECTGLLVEPHDPAALAAAVGRLLANPSLRHRMGEEGAAVVRERFTWEQVAWSTLQVYQGLACDRSNADWWAVPA